uniref:Uncharacterized protein n=1 Tax=Parascaris equorum TaxID=6256 RepID=A0A914S1Q2_PAREQ
MHLVGSNASLKIGLHTYEVYRNEAAHLSVQIPQTTIFSQLVNGVLTTACVLIGTVGNLHSIKSIHMTNFDKNRDR